MMSLSLLAGRTVDCNTEGSKKIKISHLNSVTRKCLHNFEVRNFILKPACQYTVSRFFRNVLINIPVTVVLIRMGQCAG